VPSSESASAVGVLPSRLAGGASSSCAITRRARVSTTATRSVLPLAAKSRVPARFSSSVDGCRPTVIRPAAASRPARGTNTDTVLPPHADTYTVPSGPTATPYGYRSVAKRCATRPVAASITASESARFSAAYTQRPSGDTAMPAG